MAQPVTVRVLNQHSDPVEGLAVHLYDADNTYRVDTGETDAAGEVTFAAVDEDWAYVRFFGDLIHATITTPQRFKVVTPPPANIFEFSAVTFVTPAAPGTDLCRMYGWFNPPGLGGHRVAVHITTIEIPVRLSGSRATGGFLHAASDDAGYVEVDLVRDGLYSAIISGFEGEPIIFRVPEAVSADFPAVLFPVPETLVFSPAVLALNVGDTEELEDTYLAMTGGFRVTGTTDPLLSTRVEYASSDETVATVTYGTGGVPSITGVSAGAALITATALAYTSPVVRPEVTMAMVPVAGVPVTVT